MIGKRHLKAKGYSTEAVRNQQQHQTDLEAMVKRIQESLHRIQGSVNVYAHTKTDEPDWLCSVSELRLLLDATRVK